jgi:hypothetical protein
MMMINNIYCHAIQSKEAITAEITHHTDFAFKIQNVPGGKVNILGGHSISHSKQNKKKCVCTCVLFRTVN